VADVSGVADIAAGGVRLAEAGRLGLLLAVNHSGDSDSTGGLCGSLLGARFGTAVLPGRWQAGLEVRDTIVLLAADAALSSVTTRRPRTTGMTLARLWYARHATPQADGQRKIILVVNPADKVRGDRQ
jgi:hypothetical protein